MLDMVLARDGVELDEDSRAKSAASPRKASYTM
jgi:hypothetical protein